MPSPIRRDRNQRDGNAMGVGRERASVLSPAMAQHRAERLGLDKARQRGELIDGNPGRSRRTCGRMNVASLQAQAQRRERPLRAPAARGSGTAAQSRYRSTSSWNDTGSCCQGIRVVTGLFDLTATGLSPAAGLSAYQRVPRLGDSRGELAEISGQSHFIQFGHEGADGAGR